MNNDGTVSLEALANTYNSLRSDIGSFYGSFSADKYLDDVDIEFDAATNSMKALVSISYGQKDAQKVTWQQVHYDLAFGPNDDYRARDYSGRCDNSPGVWAAPEILAYYVEQNLGLYNSLAVSVNGPFPLNINVQSFYPNSPLHTNDPDFITSSSVSNPFAVQNPTVNNYKRYFENRIDANNNGNVYCITSNGMNYYRAEQVKMIQDAEVAKGKKCIRYQIRHYAPLGLGAKLYRHGGAFEKYFGLTPIPSTGVKMANTVYVTPPSTYPTF